jgi:hypothetical protein
MQHAQRPHNCGAEASAGTGTLGWICGLDFVVKKQQIKRLTINARFAIL